MARNLDELMAARKEHQAKIAQMKQVDEAHPGEQDFQREIERREAAILYLNRRIAEWPGAE